MKRIILLVTVAMVVALMLAAAGPAFATIHEVARMECASDNASAVVQNQTPPGLTGQSQASNFGQPVFSVTPEGQPLFPGAPPELVGTNPSAGGASGNALKPVEDC
jgi:hypothetical protein